MVKRISNAELEFYETIVTCAVSIIRTVKALAYWVDDPEQLEMLLHILKDAQDIRQRTIIKKDQLKEESEKE